MNRHRLEIETLKVESFGTGVDAGGCICDYPPCGCTAGEDCTSIATSQ